ncbi:MAG TPA: hypothetical protein VMF06_01880 [Candidatus Limnocylindria bacterium]|jgi:hypothetical protein|nr:hypothetical protein [Candidatus Limnocylindria bacterium]
MKIPCSHTLAAISTTLLAITGSASNYSVKDLGPGTISDINESGHAVGNDVEGHGTFFDGTSVRVLTNLYSYYLTLDTPPSMSNTAITIR